MSRRDQDRPNKEAGAYRTYEKRSQPNLWAAVTAWATPARIL